MSQENIENITKWNSNFAPTFVDHPSLPDINFNGHSLIHYNIKNIFYIKKNLYFSYILN